jgi:hypothetical protein
MTLLLGAEIGLERISHAAIVLLMANLETELTNEDAKWDTLDQDFALLRGVDYVGCTSDVPLSENFYKGHRPSLIEAPPSRYPNVAAIAYRSVKSTDQGDQYYGHAISLGIEAMVIDGPYPQNADGSFDTDGEDLINRKSTRMMEAINAVFVKNRTMGGIIEEINDPPSTLVSECMRKRGEKGHNDVYYWQLCRLDYTIPKVSSINPSVSY